VGQPFDRRRIFGVSRSNIEVINLEELQRSVSRRAPGRTVTPRTPGAER
jgi:hypothetical protein